MTSQSEIPDDGDLVARAAQGDNNALTTLLESFGPQVRRRLQIHPKWRGIVEADDVMQVTYLEAFLQIKRTSLNSTDGFISWLQRIADNNLRDAIRGMSRSKRAATEQRAFSIEDSYVVLVERLGGTTTTPSRSAGRREIQRIIEDALQKLPPTYARVLRLMDLEGKTGPEAAEAIGRSHGAVRMLLARARDCLRETLGSGSCFFSHVS